MSGQILLIKKRVSINNVMKAGGDISGAQMTLYVRELTNIVKVG